MFAGVAVGVAVNVRVGVAVVVGVAVAVAVAVRARRCRGVRRGRRRGDGRFASAEVGRAGPALRPLGRGALARRVIGIRFGFQVLEDDLAKFDVLTGQDRGDVRRDILVDEIYLGD
jgi:hypothetical protein